MCKDSTASRSSTSPPPLRLAYSIPKPTNMAKVTDADMKRLRALKTRSNEVAVFDQHELNTAVLAIAYAVSKVPGTLPWEEYKQFVEKYAHQNFKGWAETGAAAAELVEKFLDPLKDPEQFRQIFQRVYKEGGFYRAVRYANEERPEGLKPWVVVVAGVNGIRKTTCMYQTWIKEVIHAALKEIHEDDVPKLELLPDASNSFFRQLDHLVPTCANQEFKALYNVQDLEEYTALKDGIFVRYRNIVQCFGIAMIEDVKKYKTNMLIETTGQNPGQLFYVDYFFPKEKFNKLFLHFKINDVSFAEEAVNTRMLSEMEAGYQLMNGPSSSSSVDVHDIINVNQGGSQSSKVLRKVQEDSNNMWNKVKDGEFITDWFKASITVNAHKSEPWTASATSDDPDVRSFPIERVQICRET
jgi:hypothetical protein